MRATLTPELRRVARFWAGQGQNALPPGVWNAIALEHLDREGWGTARAARALALLNVALADAGIAAWDAKYAYWSPRPENAIPALGLVRRFKPLLPTPPFPGYVSGHAAFSGAAAEVLAHLFPAAAGELRRQAAEAAESRLWGGIHFRSDSTVGLRMGRRIGELAVARARETEAH
jgi:membrane-associated phospholipid phosphatase